VTVVHLELHTHDLSAARAFYSDLLRWETAEIDNHLGAYLNEFTFRFNRRRARRRGLLFYRLLEQAVTADPVTYRAVIVNPRPTGRRPALASSPGRVAAVAAVDRPWRRSRPENTST